MEDHKKIIGCVLRDTSCPKCAYLENCRQIIKAKKQKKDKVKDK